MGAAVKKSGIPREELFITTKLWVQDTSYEGAKMAAKASMERLGLEYLDLYLIHQQTSAIQTMNRYKVQPEAWGPLSEGQRNIFQHRLLRQIADRYEKSTAQIILRWHIQQGIIVIPKSARKERMQENLDIWDFTLDSKDMDAIKTLDIGHSEIINHYSPSTAKILNNTKIH